MKVTAAIFRDGDKVLLMRRAADQPLAGEWEYPGGKFEDGEDGPTCLYRELYEELGIKMPDFCGFAGFLGIRTVGPYVKCMILKI